MATTNTKYLDGAGVAILWDQIKKTFEAKVDLVETLKNYPTEEEVTQAIADAVKDLPGALKFKGVVENLEDIAEPALGDVVIIGSAEYVYDGNQWQIFGDKSYVPDSLTEEEILAICK